MTASGSMQIDSMPAVDDWTVDLATSEDREEIYRLRHAVYAREIHQHPENALSRLTDPLDGVNQYIVVRRGPEISGFISITPPEAPRYSIDKYLPRSELPFSADGGLYEVRLLTVRDTRRRGLLSLLLMHAALRFVEHRGGRRIVAIGRKEVLNLYRRVGLVSLGRTFTSGAATYELMSATISELAECSRPFTAYFGRIRDRIRWKLEAPFEQPAACYHGGAFFDAVGSDFTTLEKSRKVINADVLDAWFPPAPAAIRAIEEHLPWLLRTSPPTNSEGLIGTIARTRGVPTGSLAVGSGSSDLIFRSFLHWLDPSSRVLLLDPTYGEYAHVLERVIGCRVDRLKLDAEDGFRLDPERLLNHPCSLIVVVNPNNPTGHHVPRLDLEAVLSRVPERTRVWVDEAYLEYVDEHESLERYAAASRNVFVCKSLSKVYALSGARAAYLCGPEVEIRGLRARTAPWAVGLVAQVAAVAALKNPDYYRVRYDETRRFREQLTMDLAGIEGLRVLSSALNFVLVRLTKAGVNAAEIVRRCRGEALYLRDLSDFSDRLGNDSLRLAVKDGQTNRRIVEILARALHQ
jgi:histidinol-phosphate/aromatic aminotransferase/cobyric acid decarboxylase-like protein